MVTRSYCWRKGVFCLLGHRVGWDQVQHAVGVGKEPKNMEAKTT